MAWQHLLFGWYGCLGLGNPWCPQLFFGVDRGLHIKSQPHHTHSPSNAHSPWKMLWKGNFRLQLWCFSLLKIIDWKIKLFAWNCQQEGAHRSLSRKSCCRNRHWMWKKRAKPSGPRAKPQKSERYPVPRFERRTSNSSCHACSHSSFRERDLDALPHGWRPSWGRLH